MNDQEIKVLARHASTAIALAFELNMVPELEGKPCRDAFQLARTILSAGFGMEFAEAVVEEAVATGEYTETNILQYIENCKKDLVLLAICNNKKS